MRGGIPLGYSISQQTTSHGGRHNTTGTITVWFLWEDSACGRTPPWVNIQLHLNYTTKRIYFGCLQNIWIRGLSGLERGNVVSSRLLKCPCPMPVSDEKHPAVQAETSNKKRRSHIGNTYTLSVYVFPDSRLTICRSSMRAFTPASISFLSWGVSGHGYNVALNLWTDEWVQTCIWYSETLHKVHRSSRLTYPSQIFLTLFLSWSPWKNMMKTDLWTWSPCGSMGQLGIW